MSLTPGFLRTSSSSQDRRDPPVPLFLTPATEPSSDQGRHEQDLTVITPPWNPLQPRKPIPAETPLVVTPPTMSRRSSVMMDFQESPPLQIWILNNTWLCVATDARSYLAQAENHFMNGKLEKGRRITKAAFRHPLKRSDTPTLQPPQPVRNRKYSKYAPSDVIERINLYLLQCCYFMHKDRISFTGTALKSAQAALKVSESEELRHLRRKSFLYCGLCEFKLQRWQMAVRALGEATDVKGWEDSVVAGFKSEARDRLKEEILSKAEHRQRRKEATKGRISEEERRPPCSCITM